MKKKYWQIKLGIILMISSGVFFALMLIFPLLELPLKVKAVGSTVSFILMELVFWTGGLLVGKELFVKYKNNLNPKNWFQRSGKKESDKSGN
jgi:hypothetical protein